MLLPSICWLNFMVSLWNGLLDAIRLQIIQQKNPENNDLYLKVLESSHIQEEE